jgi:hypothetical protein
MSTIGKACVNCYKGKPSWISLATTDLTFTKDTTVTVKDEMGNTWDAKPKFRGDPKHLPIKLQGLVTKKEEDPPPSGTLTVTVSNPTVNPPPTVPVDYVNDPT